MSYYGRSADNISNVIKLDNITFNGGTTYALTQNGVAFVPNNSSSILISIDGVVQQGNFTVNSSNIVFNFSPTSSNTCNWILHIGVGVAYVPAASSITKDKTDFVSTSSSAGLTIKGDGTTDGYIGLSCSQNSHAVKIKAPSHSSSQSYTLTLPGTAPAADKMLQTDGSGNLSFVDAPGGGLTVVASSYSSTDTTGGVLSFPSFVSTDYDHYKVIGFCVPGNDNVDFWMRPHNASGHYSQSNQFYYEYQARYRSSSGGGDYSNGSWQDSKWKIADNVNRDSDSNFVAFNIDLYEWGTHNTSRLAFGGTSFHHQHSDGMKTVNMGGSLHGNIDATGLDFLFSGGQIDKHGITIYGVNKS